MSKKRGRWLETALVLLGGCVSGSRWPEADALPALQGASAILVDAGASPRRLLRYEIEPGTRQTADVEYEFHTRRFSGRTTRENVLSWRARFEVHVTAVDPAGAATCEIGVDSGFLEDRADDGTSQRYDLAGTSARATIDRSGSLEALELLRPGPDRVVPAHRVRGMLETALTSPLPSHPVGVGARWDVRFGDQGGAWRSVLDAVNGRELRTTSTPPPIDGGASGPREPGTVCPTGCEFSPTTYEGKTAHVVDLRMPIPLSLRWETRQTYTVPLETGAEQWTLFGSHRVTTVEPSNGVRH